MAFFQLYQYVVPVLCFPLAYWLWWLRYGGDHRLVILALSIPVLFAYIIPALGTNWLRLWEFHTRFRLGHFRPHHGFVLGTATSLFALLCLEFPASAFNLLELFRAGFILGSVLAFWNWVYDLYAIHVGFIVVYNRKYHEGQGAAAIATDYCPVFFGVFGLCYGLAIRVSEHVLLDLGRWDLYGPLLVACHVIVLACPVLAYLAWSLMTTGESGLRTYKGLHNEQ